MRRPAAGRLAVRGLPGHRDREPLQRHHRRDRPVAAHRQPRPGGGDAAHRVLPVGAHRTEPRQDQRDHARLQARPQRLEVGDHPELGEPRDVGGVDDVHVRDDRPAVTRRRSRAARPLDGVQRGADARVADRVDVHLEAGRVERRHRLGELGGRPDRQTAAVRAVEVRLEHRAGAHLDDAVGEELHRAGADVRVGRPRRSWPPRTPAPASRQRSGSARRATFTRVDSRPAAAASR